MTGRKMLRELFRTGERFTHAQLEERVPLSSRRISVYCYEFKTVGGIRRIGSGKSAVWVADNKEALGDYVLTGNRAKNRASPLDHLPVERAAIQSRPVLATVWAQA